jgi:hypothetical protein
MADPQLANAKRRLALMLRDEEYGPKLARLRGTDERRVLDLIYENRGMEARSALRDLDAARRLKRSLRDIARDYTRKSPDRRSADWKSTRNLPTVKNAETDFWELYSAMMAGSAA